MSPQPLPKVLSAWDVFFIAVGQIIGAGVIALTGIAIGMTGPSVVFAYLVAALLVLVVTLLIMMAGTVLPAVGAYYTWTSRLSGGWLGSIVLLLILLASVSLSLYGSSFGMYLSPLLPMLSPNGWGIVVIALLFLANLFGLNMAAKVQVALVLALASALGLYAGFAMPNIQSELLSPWLPAGAAGFITAVFLLKFATSGAYMIVGLSGEMHNPARVIPLVMTVATVVVALLYALVALGKCRRGALARYGRSTAYRCGPRFYARVGDDLLPDRRCRFGDMHHTQFAIYSVAAHFLGGQLGSIAAGVGWALESFQAPYWILTIMLLVGVVPLIVGLDIGDIARAATISASLPAIFVYWAITRIPREYPRQYAQSIFAFSPFWLWTLFVVSELSLFVGVYFLALDLSASVVITLAVWVLVTVAYYPMRRAYLQRQGFDLNAATMDRGIFDNSSA
jgi:APA family basic amino acid/polyamine antiporter